MRKDRLIGGISDTSSWCLERLAQLSILRKCSGESGLVAIGTTSRNADALLQVARRSREVAGL